MEEVQANLIRRHPYLELYLQSSGDKPNYMTLSAVSEFAISARLEALGYKVYKSSSQRMGPDILAYNYEHDFVITCSISCVPNKTWPFSKKVRNIMKSSKRKSSVYVYYDISSDMAYVFTQEELEKLPSSFSLKDVAEEEWSKLYAGF